MTAHPTLDILREMAVYIEDKSQIWVPVWQTIVLLPVGHHQSTFDMVAQQA
jgi:hypothetical protein